MSCVSLPLQVTTELFIRVQVAPSNPLNSAPFFSAALESLPPPTFLLHTNSSFSVELVAIMADIFDEDSTILPLTLPPDGIQLVAMEAEWVQVGSTNVSSNNTNSSTSDDSVTLPYGECCTYVSIYCTVHYTYLLLCAIYVSTYVHAYMYCMYMHAEVYRFCLCTFCFYMVTLHT